MYEDEKEENEQPEEKTGAEGTAEGNDTELDDATDRDGTGEVPESVGEASTGDDSGSGEDKTPEEVSPDAVPEPVNPGMSKKAYQSALLDMGGDVPGVNKYRYTAVNPVDYDSLKQQDVTTGTGFLVIDLNLACVADERVPVGQVELRRRSMEVKIK